MIADLSRAVGSADGKSYKDMSQVGLLLLCLLYLYAYIFVHAADWLISLSMSVGKGCP